VAESARIRIGDEEFSAADAAPFVFGRSDADGVVGLNADDMGVSAVAGSVELAWGVWWVVNGSTKRRLLVETAPGADPVTIECGHRHALVTPRIRILVPGALYTYVLELDLPEDYASQLLRVEGSGSSGTIVPGEDVPLTVADRTALAAMFSGFLEPWPHRRDLPNSYEAAARLAGPDWTDTAIRKRIERIRERFREAGFYFEGDRAREELVGHLISNGLLSGADLDLLPGRGVPAD
jgi:hypothetical protein